MFRNISYIPSSLDDEKLELFDLEVLELYFVKLEPWFENEPWSSNEKILQLEWEVKERKKEWEVLPFI